jgi:hypothetical protein
MTNRDCQAVELGREQRLAWRGRGSPYVRRVLTRMLFLACFGVGDFSVLHGRHALASQRPIALAIATTSSSAREKLDVAAPVNVAPPLPERRRLH